DGREGDRARVLALAVALQLLEPEQGKQETGDRRPEAGNREAGNRRPEERLTVHPISLFPRHGDTPKVLPMS
ncbi:MAG: hypothetical protein KAQ69_10540, partial [Spirochaetales bacterium]|nr:hypothetical protein [Spirochaetales bacterium]